MAVDGLFRNAGFGSNRVHARGNETTGQEHPTRAFDDVVALVDRRLADLHRLCQRFRHVSEPFASENVLNNGEVSFNLSA